VAEPRQSEKKLRLWIRMALSAVIAFHLFAIVLSPNKNTWLGYQCAKIVEPYVNALELASSWSFFAPDPGPPPIFVEWQLENKKGEMIEKGRWPDSPDPYFLRERQNRRIATARFMAMSDERTEQVLLPYLCRTRPQAFSVKLWRTVYTLPSLTDVVKGKRKIGDDVGMDRRWVSQSFCDRGSAS
jgi:hypothetical protein